MEPKLRRLVLIDYREDAIGELVDLVLEDDQCVSEPINLALAADLLIRTTMKSLKSGQHLRGPFVPSLPNLNPILTRLRMKLHSAL